MSKNKNFQYKKKKKNKCLISICILLLVIIPILAIVFPPSIMVDVEFTQFTQAETVTKEELTTYKPVESTTIYEETTTLREEITTVPIIEPVTEITTTVPETTTIQETTTEILVPEKVKEEIMYVCMPVGILKDEPSIDVCPSKLLPYGTQVTRIAEDGCFSKILYEGKEYWICSLCISKMVVLIDCPF